MKKILNANDNIQSIQFFRGVAALLVVLSHSTVNTAQVPANHIISRICGQGWVGVNIFFVISGFIIPYSMYKQDYQISDFRNFFAKRLIRIEPPYIVSIIMILLLNYSNTLTPWYHGPAFKVDWLNVFGHLGYLNAYTQQPWLNGVYWTLAIEFQFYLIMALLFSFITHKNKVILMLTFFALLACTFIRIPHFLVMPYAPFSMTMHFQDTKSHILPFLPFFLMGIGLFLLRVNKINTREFIAMITISFIVCFYRHGIILTSICIGALIGINYIKRVPKPLLLLGTISYSLYLTHYMLITRFIGLAGRFTHMGITMAWILGIIGCLIFAYFYYLVFEKPFVKISKRINFKHSPEIISNPQESILSGANDVINDKMSGN